MCATRRLALRLSLLLYSGNIFGYAFEADEVARCIRDGKIESDRMPLRETILMMEVCPFSFGTENQKRFV